MTIYRCTGCGREWVDPDTEPGAHHCYVSVGPADGPPDREPAEVCRVCPDGGECRGCGVVLPGGGYLCDACDELEIVETDCSAGWRAEARHQRASAGRDHE